MFYVYLLMLLTNSCRSPIARDLGKMGGAEGGESAEADAPDEFANRIVCYGNPTFNTKTDQSVSHRTL